MSEPGTGAVSLPSKAEVRRRQPPFLEAVLADARVTCLHRGELDQGSSRGAEIRRALRLVWRSDAFLAQVLYRLQARMFGLGVPILPRLAQALAMMLAQMSIDESVVIRPGVCIAHGQVVIAGLTEIRPGTLIAPFVSIGLVAGDFRGPTIGPQAVIGTGARLLGPITVGRRARIGANAVVLEDVPEGATAAGVPARVRPERKA